jgi:transcriptional regulator with XRE-family HTH domain
MFVVLLRQGGLDMIFGERLRDLRARKFLSKTQLAQDLGITRQLVRLYESGETMPNITLFAEIADYFDVSADYLLGRDGFSVSCDKCGGTNGLTLPDELTNDDQEILANIVKAFCEQRNKAKS